MVYSGSQLDSVESSKVSISFDRKFRTEPNRLEMNRAEFQVHVNFGSFTLFSLGTVNFSNLMPTKSKSKRTKTNRIESQGKFLPNEFEIFNFFLIFFQIFMIKLRRASFALNLLNLMIHSSKQLVRFAERIESNSECALNSSVSHYILKIKG